MLIEFHYLHRISLSSNVGLGSFEQNTRGIDMKLIRKMGFNGVGLGINGQGIVHPIEVKNVPDGLGYHEKTFSESSWESFSYFHKRGHSKDCCLDFNRDRKPKWFHTREGKRKKNASSGPETSNS